jgi:hypothetical protein
MVCWHRNCSLFTKRSSPDSYIQTILPQSLAARAISLEGGLFLQPGGPVQQDGHRAAARRVGRCGNQKPSVLTDIGPSRKRRSDVELFVLMFF